jgi:hypothetical protein
MDTSIKKYTGYAKQCIGSDEFKHYFVIRNKKNIDLLENGKFSCAKFVSEFKLMSCVHVNVLSAVRDMKKANWKNINIDDLKIGDVIVWEKNKSGHYHIGFYIGDNRAISNSLKYRSPQEHHYTYNGKRKIKWVFRFGY